MHKIGVLKRDIKVKGETVSKGSAVAVGRIDNRNPTGAGTTVRIVTSVGLAEVPIDWLELEESDG